MFRFRGGNGNGNGRGHEETRGERHHNAGRREVAEPDRKSGGKMATAKLIRASKSKLLRSKLLKSTARTGEPIAYVSAEHRCELARDGRRDVEICGKHGQQSG